MKVTDTRTVETTTIEDMEIGTVFKEDNLCYMKIEQVKDEDGMCYNAVCLNNGELDMFGCGLSFEELNVELVIK